MLHPTLHLHYERIAYENGDLIGRCKCGLVRKYDPEGITPPVTIKEGNMDKSNDNASTIPPRPASPYKMRQYYDDNKEAILRDLKELGEKGMLKRWGISQATWLCHRKDGRKQGVALRFGIIPTEEPAALEPEKSPLSTNVDNSYHELPMFPAFNDTWGEKVQVKWFETYLTLLIHKSGGNV